MFMRVLVAAVALLIPYLYSKIRYKRLKQYARFAQLPPSAILGHLQALDEFIKRAPPKAHADVAIAAIHRTLGRPPVMLIDLRPISPPLVVIGSYEVAEQLVKASSRFPYSPPKAPETWNHLEHLTGPTSIAATQGESWKALRKRFNPGFAPQHLLSLLPSIIDKSFLFLHHLDDLSRSGNEFSLQELATNLTFDVIGRVVLDIDMGAQSDNPTDFMRVFHELIKTYADEQVTLPWWCTPFIEWKRHRLAKRARNTLKSIVRERYAELSQASKSRSILSMSLHGVEDLNPRTIDVTCDQLSTFLFAGHDTTSTMLAWTFYELSRTPHALKAVRAEMDELFGPDPNPESVRERLTGPGGEELVHRMIYTTAVIREVLRLWPPGGTARTTKPGDGLTVTLPASPSLPNGGSNEVNLDGVMIYPIHSIIQRDPAIFGDTADVFIPERWLDQDATDKIPAGAWRAFERGPRGCIGQELAMIEARVLVALTVRRYDFTKIGIGAASLNEATGQPEIGKHGQYKVAEEMYMKMQVTSKPVDDMMMKVKIVA
ncbi:cytochrome P450 [Annulohypoxylon nitens]|nr:cytochrome P450 [Annulohypoxylon nitens]